MTTSEFYYRRAQHFQQNHKQTEKVITQLAWARVILVLLIGVLIYLGFSTPLLFWLIPILLGFFIVLINRQKKKEDEKQLLSYLQLLNQKEEKALLFESSDFPNGIRFADPHHPFSHDLDLFGAGSVFEYLNRCGTQLGEERLANDLKNVSLTDETLRARQEAVKELGTMVEFRQQVWALGHQIHDIAFDRFTILNWLKEKPFIYRNGNYTLLRWGLPVVTLGAVGFTYYDWKYFPLLLIMMSLQITIAGFHAKRILEFQRILSSGKNVLGNYARILEQLAKQQVESTLMKKHQATAFNAFEKVKEFSSLVNALEARMNPIAMLFGNGLFLYDFHSVARLEKWRAENACELPDWLESLGEWDSLLSLATLHYNFPQYVFAEVNSNSELKGKAVGHLLIPASVRITNNFELGKPANIWLITGANMAGKSTFLRSLGVNFVLGSMGSPVCASHWSMPLIALRSGMRTTDSLKDHQSYFFAELHRLQAIMEELRSGKKVFILLDEILKGTNSTDKQLGSRQLLKQLKDMNALVVLATHDIALGDLAEQYPNQIANACFEGKIVDDQLAFDYKLNPGIAQKANATFLMRKMGIIPTQEF